MHLPGRVLSSIFDQGIASEPSILLGTWFSKAESLVQDLSSVANSYHLKGCFAISEIGIHQ